MTNEEMMTKVSSIMERVEDVSIKEEEVEKLVKEGTVNLMTMPNGVTTYVELELASGFKVIETSTCCSKELYDENLGLEICMRKIKDRLWAYLSFHKHQIRKEAKDTLKLLKPSDIPTE